MVAFAVIWAICYLTLKLYKDRDFLKITDAEDLLRRKIFKYKSQDKIKNSGGFRCLIVYTLIWGIIYTYPLKIEVVHICFFKLTITPVSSRR